MGRYGQVAGKRPMSGHNVSYANNITNRQFLPNLHRKRYFLKSEDCSVSLSVSVHGMKGIDTKGLVRVVADMRAAGEEI